MTVLRKLQLHCFNYETNKKIIIILIITIIVVKLMINMLNIVIKNIYK